jgi:hypothetical protein
MSVMIAFSMLAAGIALVLAVAMIMSVAMTRDAAVTAIGGLTIPATAATPLTSPADRSDAEWKMIELNDIFKVEALLDTLEASNATKTEVEMTADDKFTVRWR